MAIYDFFLSRNNGPTIDNYVGHAGRLFYDGANGVIKLSDGVTPGGLSIPYTIATDTVIGGIKAGPGVTINSEGQILIDSAGLTFTFGDLQGTVGTYAVDHPDAGEDYALLNSINLNEDIVIASNGTGVVKVLGDFSVRATDGNIDAVLLNEPVFRVNAAGQIRMLVPSADAATGALEIIGNTAGEFHPPNQTGVILHITGNNGVIARSYIDANNNYPIIVGRRYNGTVGAETQVLNNEVIFRIAGQASTGSSFETFGPAKINWIATEDQGPNNQGGKITFDVTANGTNAFSNVITALQITPEGITTPVGFKGSVTIGSGNTLDVTGATVTGLTLGGLNPADVAGTMTGTTIKSTVTGSSLTSVGTLTGLTVNGTGAFTTITGKNIQNYRNAGVIADGGIVVINFATDAVVYCEWDNSITINYSNYTVGSVIKLIAFKRAGTGTDSFSLDGLTAGHVSTGSTTVSGTAGIANFVEFICTGTTIDTVFAKL